MVYKCTNNAKLLPLNPCPVIHCNDVCSILRNKYIVRYRVGCPRPAYTYFTGTIKKKERQQCKRAVL